MPVEISPTVIVGDGTQVPDLDDDDDDEFDVEEEELEAVELGMDSDVAAPKLSKSQYAWICIP